MKRKLIRLTESDLHNMIRKSVNKILKEENETYLYQGDEENEDWEMAEITPWDFHLEKDDEIADFHQSREGYIAYFNDEEFGEVWYENSTHTYRGVSDDDIFDGYKRAFEGANLDGIIADMCDKVADTILNGNDDDEFYEDDEDYDDYEDDDIL